MESKNISLIIVSCRKYNDVLTMLMKRLNDFSFLSLPFDRIYLATDSVLDDINYKELYIDEVVTGIGWGERVRNALKKVDTEYCLVVLDDYIPYKKHNTNELFKIFDLKENYDCVYLSSVFSDMKKGNKIKKLSGYREVPNNFLYRVNTTVGVWKVNSLLSVLSDNDSPWEWEAFAGLSEKGSLMKFAAPEDEFSQTYFYSYKTGGAVYRGEWVYDVLVSLGYDADFILNLSDRGVVKKLGGSKRSIYWKIKFLYRGYNMVGVRFLNFIYYSYFKK